MTTAEAIVAQRIRIAEGSGRQHIVVPLSDAWKILQAITDKARAGQ